MGLWTRTVSTQSPLTGKVTVAWYFVGSVADGFMIVVATRSSGLLVRALMSRLTLGSGRPAPSITRAS